MSNSNSESQSQAEAIPRKKIKRASKWQDEWKRYNMCVSRRGPTFVHCCICGTDFSVASGGVNEVKRHAQGKRHTERAQQTSSQASIATMFQKDVDSVRHKTTAAEVYFASFIAEHNLHCISFLQQAF